MKPSPNPPWVASLLILPGLLGLLPPPLHAGNDPNQLLNLRGIPKGERTLLPVEFTWPERAGEAALCLWRDDKMAVLSYTIDDNCAMNIDWWLQQTAARDLKVTWFLVPSGILSGKSPMNGSWDDWKKVRAAGHGLESHTVSHLSASRNVETWQGIEWEYRESRTMVEAGLGEGHRVTCLAYPGGSYPGKNDPEAAAKYFIAARGTKAMLNGPQGLNYLDVNASSKGNFGERPSAAFSNADNLMNPGYKAGYRGWYVVLYHYIKGDGPSVQADLDYAVKHRDKLWIGRFSDVARYAQERETSKLAVTESGPARIVLSLTDRMDDRLFDFPLTVKIRLPDDWKAVTAIQRDAPAAARIVEHEGGRFALVDVVPDRGATVLVP